MTLGSDNPTADPTTTILLRHGDTRLSPEHRFCINKIQWHGREFAAVHCVNDTSHLP